MISYKSRIDNNNNDNNKGYSYCRHIYHFTSLRTNVVCVRNLPRSNAVIICFFFLIFSLNHDININGTIFGIFCANAISTEKHQTKIKVRTNWECVSGYVLVAGTSPWILFCYIRHFVCANVNNTCGLSMHTCAHVVVSRIKLTHTAACPTECTAHTSKLSLLEEQKSKWFNY